MTIDCPDTAPVAPAAGVAEEARRVESVSPAESTRDAFRRALLDLARRDSRVWCLDGDTGAFDQDFAVAYPERYVNLGISEANLIGVAAGLAAAGKIPFVVTMAAFATGRAFEQVKLDVSYNARPVKIVGTHGGTSAGHLGPTHHALEDVALMRVLPGLVILVPADGDETARATEFAWRHTGPVYLRLGRKATPPIYGVAAPLPLGDFDAGRAVVLREGGDVTVAASGPHPVLIAVEAAEVLRSRGVSAAVLNLHTLKPLDTEALGKAARETGGLVTVEDHSRIGGLGSAAAEFLAESGFAARLRRVGVPDRFCVEVGSHSDLLAAAGITVAAVVDAALDLAAGRAAAGRSTVGRATTGRAAGRPSSTMGG